MTKYQYVKMKKYENVYSYETTKGVKYMFTFKYYNEQGKRKEKSMSGFSDPKTAYRKCLEMKISAEKNDVTNLEPTKITVGEWYDIWINSNSNWSSGTLASRKMVGREYVKPLIGHIKLKDLTLAKYELIYIKGLRNSPGKKSGTKMNPSTVLLYHYYMHICLNAAVKRKIIQENITHDASLPKKEQAKLNYLNTETLSRVINDIRENEPLATLTLTLTLVFTGMRIGEAFGLQWKHIDFTNGKLIIEQSRKTDGVSETKNRKSREITIPDELVRALKKYRIWAIKRMFRNGEQLTEDSLVFISKHTGRPMSWMVMTKCLERVEERTGIKITPHGFRHTHATLLAAENIPITNIAKRLGNTPQTLLKTYIHPLDDKDREIVSVFNQTTGLSELLSEQIN